jgi:hypothetical protein
MKISIILMNILYPCQRQGVNSKAVSLNTDNLLVNDSPQQNASIVAPKGNKAENGQIYRYINTLNLFKK